MIEPGHRNDIDGTVNGPVLQARTVTARTIIMRQSAAPPVPTPHQFPPSHPVWTNRGRELGVLDELAAGAAPTRALLTGVGGIGKTELAIRWLTNQRARHPDGELYVDLSTWRDQPPAPPNQVLAAWLRALGVPLDALPADLSELTALYRSVTAEKALLILIDNASSTEQVHPLIPTSPASTILVTSRRSLRGLILTGFHQVELDYFTPYAGGGLLAALLARTPVADEGALLTLASRCHGHPLTLAIAGAHLVVNPHRSPTDLITRLNADHGATLALHVEEASVGGILDMSYDDLDAGTARLYRMLAVHPGAEFTADPLAAALDLPVTEVEQGLARLADAHLVTAVAASRYRQHDLPREHAEVLAARHDEASVRRAALRSMIEWYLRRTAAADIAINPRSRRFSPVYEQLDTEPFNDAEHALSWFAVERANVLASQYLAAEEGWDGLVFQLAEVVWNPLRPSYFADDLVNTQQLGIVAAQRCKHVLEAVFLTRLGFGESNRAHHDAAIAACATAIDRAKAIGDSWVLSAALSTRARALTAAGQPRAALEDLGSALSLDEQRGDRRSVALRHRRIGQAYAHPDIADFPQAIWHVREAAELMDLLGDAAAHARAITYLAEVHVNARQPDAALFNLRRIEEFLSSYGSPRYRGHAYTVMGRAHMQLGNIAEADRCYGAALNLFDDAGPGAANDREAVLALRHDLAGMAAQDQHVNTSEEENGEPTDELSE
ncbi:MAG TPA: ATP-binding protein [Pseudonocardiaceae bacterium]|nr:ATP-binding protein [Pseudonocardiaceae bacterium]